MRIAIMQPYFFPYLGYFQLINCVDTFVIFDDVNFINRGWINRNNILLNGSPHLIHVPLIEASQNKLINEILVVSETKWRTKLLKNIEHSYKRAPYFDPVYAIFESVIQSSHALISLLNLFGIQKVCDYLKINTKLVESSSIYENKSLKGQDRIIDICKKEKAEQYVNPSGGIELYDKSIFKEEGIQLNFLISKKTPYQQFKNEFVPYLSILDIMMFNSVEEINDLLNNGYELT